MAKKSNVAPGASPSQNKLTDEWGQFAAIPVIVIEMIPEIGANAFTLFCYLRRLTNQKRGCAWPSYKTMRKELGWGKRRISNAIKELETAGLLTRKKRYSNSTEYRLTRPKVGRDSQLSRNGTNEVESDSISRDIEPQLSRSTEVNLNLVDLDLDSGGGHHQSATDKTRLLKDLGMYPSLVEEYAADFEIEDLEILAGIVESANFDPGKSGAYAKAILDRWRESPEDLSRDHEISKAPANERGRRRYQQGQFADFWDA